VPGDLAQQVLASASLFLGLAREGRIQQGAGTIACNTPSAGQTEIGVQIVAAAGKPAMTMDFPDPDPDMFKRGLEALGMHPAVMKRVKSAIGQKSGGLVVAGPRSAGRTTTLYALVSEIDVFTTDALVVAKELIHELDSVRTRQLDTDRPFDDVFAEIQREGPQAIMFSDLESSVQAGHLLKYAATEGLLLTDVQSPDAAAALLALKKLGKDAELVGNGVSCVIAQRLVRRLCLECREEVEPNPQVLARLKLDPNNPGRWYRPVGCNSCLDSGFQGRVGIFEMLIITDPVKRALAEADVTAAKIRAAAGDTALRSMYQDGLTKVTAGITTLEELSRVLKQQSAPRQTATGGNR
jgi:general secretion pathway protein E